MGDTLTLNLNKAQIEGTVWTYCDNLMINQASNKKNDDSNKNQAKTDSKNNKVVLTALQPGACNIYAVQKLTNSAKKSVGGNSSAVVDIAVIVVDPVTAALLSQINTGNPADMAAS
jgi:hypothetical protein